MDIDQDCLTVGRVSTEPVLVGPVKRSKVRNMTEDALNHLPNQLDERGLQFFEEYIIGIMEIIEDDHNTLFVRSALKWACRNLLFVLTDDDEVHDALGVEIIQEYTSAQIAQAITMALKLF